MRVEGELRVISAVLAALCLIACEGHQTTGEARDPAVDEGRPAPLAIRTAPTSERAPAPQRAVASLNGQPYSMADLAGYVDVARSRGYRPATAGEGRRLLHGFLLEMLLDQEIAARGLPLDPAGRERALAQLIAEYGAPVEVTEEDVRRHSESRARISRTRAAAADDPLASGRVREQLRSRRESAQRRAILEHLLERAALEIEPGWLDDWAQSPVARRGGSPLVPPGFRSAERG